jgi:FHS family L-fucose permease-like MFS transporter
VLGPSDGAAARINIAQSANGIGWILGPIVGGMFFYGSTDAAANHERLYIPYLGIAIVVLLLAIVFAFAKIPDLQTEDAYRVDDSKDAAGGKSIWSHPHFSGAVLAQFLYIAAQAGIFSFFINYIVSDTPPIPASFAGHWLIGGASGSVYQEGNGLHFISEMGATKLLGLVGFVLFLLGRFVGSALVKFLPAHKVFGTFALINTALMAVISAQCGWFSVIALLLSFFFMSIMFPTIFALGIYGLGRKAKLASSFLVMAIMGGAIMPKLMGWFSDHYGHIEGYYGRAIATAGHANQNLMSPGFIVPLFCFAYLAVYGFAWKRLSRQKTANQAKA